MDISESKQRGFKSKPEPSMIPEMDEEQTHSNSSSARARNNNVSESTNGLGQKAVLEKQTSRTDVSSLGMGSKKASLYLSRTKSLIKPDFQSSSNEGRRTCESRGHGTSSRKGSFHSDTDKNDSFYSKKTSVSSMQREFTFTGYDIMTDSKYTIHLYILNFAFYTSIISRFSVRVRKFSLFLFLRVCPLACMHDFVYIVYANAYML